MNCRKAPNQSKMKKVKLNKKLQLNKETIAKLNTAQMNGLVGGSTPVCTVGATCSSAVVCCLPSLGCAPTSNC
jgi:natural product precursor